MISVPASIASGLSSGARRGLLMKGGAVIEATANAIRGAFDRTGTLTDDNPRTAAAIAKSLGLDHEAGLMPEDKVAAVRAMAARGVMMVGDGIDDAPALAQASVGVAMGSGTDVALEAADAALRNRVTDVAALVRLARATMGNVRQNVTVTLGLKAVFLVATVLGVTGLWIAILADTGATALVTLDAAPPPRLRPRAGAVRAQAALDQASPSRSKTCARAASKRTLTAVPGTALVAGSASTMTWPAGVSRYT